MSWGCPKCGYENAHIDSIVRFYSDDKRPSGYAFVKQGEWAAVPIDDCFLEETKFRCINCDCDFTEPKLIEEDGDDS